MLNKKVIQVPIDNDLLYSLDSLSEKQGRARAELIREACRLYIQKISDEELDRLYMRGYKKIPEDAKPSCAQVAAAGEVLPMEQW